MTFVSPLSSVYMWIVDLFIHWEQVPVAEVKCGGSFFIIIFIVFTLTACDTGACYELILSLY